MAPICGTSTAARADKINDCFGVESTSAVRLRVSANGSYMAGQCTANQEPLAKFGTVPISDDEFLEMPARYPTLDVPFDVC
jgi:hypothetical protein